MWTIFKAFIEFVTVLLLFYRGFFGHEACGILAPGPGIKPVPPALEVQSLNHWTSREVPSSIFFNDSKKWNIKMESELTENQSRSK